MHILVIGAAGMVGRKFVEKLARDGTLGGKPVSRITAFDVVAATPPEASFPIDVHTGDFPESGMAEALIPWIQGSHSAVVGLPLHETVSLLTGAGYPVHFNWLNQANLTGV